MSEYLLDIKNGERTLCLVGFSSSTDKSLNHIWIAHFPLCLCIKSVGGE